MIKPENELYKIFYIFFVSSGECLDNFKELRAYTGDFNELVSTRY